MSNSNYSIGLQRLKPVHTAYCGLHNLAANWSWARDVNGRDRDETLVRLETETTTLIKDSYVIGDTTQNGTRMKWTKWNGRVMRRKGNATEAVA